MSDNNVHTNSDEILIPEALPANRTDMPPVSDTARKPRIYLQRVETTTISYSGEVPPPWMLQAFEDVGEGFANRILTMAEEQAKHRQSLERGVVFGNIVNARVAAALGTIIVLGSMALAGFLALHGLSGQAIALVLTEIVSLAGVALYRNYAKKKSVLKKIKTKKRANRNRSIRLIPLTKICLQNHRMRIKKGCTILV